MVDEIKKMAIEQLETITRSLETERPDNIKKALVWAREMTQQSINRRSDVRSQLHFLVQGATHLGRAKALVEML
jgi:hypothetical protein